MYVYEMASLVVSKSVEIIPHFFSKMKTFLKWTHACIDIWIVA